MLRSACTRYSLLLRVRLRLQLRGVPWLPRPYHAGHGARVGAAVPRGRQRHQPMGAPVCGLYARAARPFRRFEPQTRVRHELQCGESIIAADSDPSPAPVR